MKTAAQLVAEGYGGYAGWGDPEAGYDFQATGGSGKYTGSSSTSSGSGQTAADYAQAIIDAQKKQIDEETKWVEDYLKDNPFVFDETLARQASKAEYLPYYSELLKDYLYEVGQKRTTIQDEAKLLKELRTLDVGQRTKSYEYAVQQAERGYEGKGLFSSGMRARDIGKEAIQYKTGMEEATGKYEAGLSGYEKELAGLGEAEMRQRRDIFGSEEELGGVAGTELPTGERGGQFQTAFEGGVEQRRGEQYKQYYTPLVQAYARRFPTSSNALAGYLPPEYLKY